MKNTLLTYPISLLLIILIATSCQAPKDLVYRDFKNLKVEQMGFAATTLKVDVVYYNPNRFGLQLKYIDLDIYVNNNYLGHSTQDYQITIPKLSEFSIPLAIQVDMKNLLKNGFATLLGKEVNLKMTGSVKLGKANVYKNFPVNYEGVQVFSALQ